MNAVVRLFAWLIALAVVALPVVAVLNGWLAAGHWPIQRLLVTAEYQRVNAEQVRAAVQPHIGLGYFALDLARVRESVAALPWVERVEVRKRWPDVLELVVIEHRAYAHWGQDKLLSFQGDIFKVPGTQELQGLPRLSGPKTRVREVIEFYESAQRAFAGTGLSVAGARLTSRGSWALELSTGAQVMVGRADAPMAKVQKLIKVLPKLLAGEMRAVRRIDLRYSNGFAVEWAEPQAPETAHTNFPNSNPVPTT
jgi:cell division protein FtsQ